MRAGKCAAATLRPAGCAEFFLAARRFLRQVPRVGRVARMPNGEMVRGATHVGVTCGVLDPVVPVFIRQVR